MRSLRSLAWIALVLSIGCDGGTTPSDGGQTNDAGPPPRCADPSAQFVFPSPRWESSEGLVVPDQDAAGDAVRAQGWDDEIGAIDAWPRRPTLVLPLDRSATATDATRVHLAVRDGDAWREVDAPFSITLVTDRYVVVQPRDPFAPGVREVLIAFEDGVAGDARVLGACAGADPDPAYASAASEWPSDQTLELAMHLAIADSSAPLAKLRDRLAATPVLDVAASEAVALTELGEDAPSAEMAPHFAPRIVRGQLSLPDYRPAGGGPMTLADDGAPMSVGTTGPAFVVALPATGSAPYPVILYQHGGGGSPTDIFDFGGTLAAAGFAFVAIDLPEHGLRGPAGGGGELDFLDFDSPQHTRENFRQTVADHLAVLAGFDALNATIQTALGVEGALDRSRTFYMGMSLGAVSGSMTTATARGLTASALFVGGAGYPELLRYGLFAVAAQRTLRGGEPRPSVMLAVVETIADASDPLAYAQAAEDRSARPTPILFLQAIGDPLIAAEASDQWARAYGASLARPFDHEALGMTAVDLPASDTFAWTSGGPAATRVLVHNPMVEVQPTARHGALILQGYAEELVARCFSSARDDGSCEVVDTGFASH